MTQDESGGRGGAARRGRNAAATPGEVHRGRGATCSPAPRYLASEIVRESDGWETPDPQGAPQTRVRAERPRKLLSWNRSPDLPFDRAINPYRGCEHGCVYCFARPTHAWLDMSPGLDFETRLIWKRGAAQALARELARPGYRPAPVALGASTDPYQPIEKRYRVTREVLETLSRFEHPVSIVTKGSLIERDLDLLADLARRRLVSVAVSVTTLDAALKRRLEPRATSGERRLQTIARLAEAGVPVSVLVAPVIPFVNDAELEGILERAAAAGARGAGYVVLRLPHELVTVFDDWLASHYPARRERVLNAVRAMRGGALYDATFGVRQRGTGPLAELIAKRFRLAATRHGLTADGSRFALDVSRFAVPAAMAGGGREAAHRAGSAAPAAAAAAAQMTLFDA